MVKQRGKNDCGIAAIANATGQSYKSIKKRFGKMDRGGMQLHEIDWLLNEFGTWKERRGPRFTTSVTQWAKRRKTGKYVVLLNTLGWMNLSPELHAVAVVDGQVMGHFAEKWHVECFWREE